MAEYQAAKASSLRLKGGVQPAKKKAKRKHKDAAAMAAAAAAARPLRHGKTALSRTSLGSDKEEVTSACGGKARGRERTRDGVSDGDKARGEREKGDGDRDTARGRTDRQ